MPATVEELGITKLSVSDRLDLIEQIWDSLPPAVDPNDVPAWHLEELARRLVNPSAGKPWREVLDSLGPKS